MCQRPGGALGRVQARSSPDIRRRDPAAADDTEGARILVQGAGGRQPGPKSGAVSGGRGLAQQDRGVLGAPAATSAQCEYLVARALGGSAA